MNNATRSTWLVRFHRLGSPPSFYHFSGLIIPWVGATCLILIVAGLYGGLYLAPTDYQQGESYRIIYIHVPSAWMSMFVYVVLAASSAIGLIWRMKLAEAIARAAAPIGATYTFIALITGSLWGKPMWGTWWVWDARLTSELILLFLYLGYIALVSAFDDRRTASRAGAVLALVGVVNLPIIHFSVEWWNTLHQGPTITQFDKPSIAMSMLVPLLLTAAGFKFHFLVTLLASVRAEILDGERRTAWVTELLARKTHA
ncbi:heme ABC transporter permease [Arenicellales bacterium IMCC56312]